MIVFPIALVLAVVVILLCRPDRRLTFEQDYRFKVTMAPFMAETWGRLRRDLDKQVWGRPTGQQVLGLDVLVNDDLPPDKVYVINRAAIHHEPFQFDWSQPVTSEATDPPWEAILTRPFYPRQSSFTITDV